MSNVCPCPKPPGGQIVCRDDQLAICGYRDGEVVSGCYDQPEALRQVPDDDVRSLQAANWALSIIKGVRYDLTELLSEEDANILVQGRFFIPGSDIKFKMPDGLNIPSSRALARTL